jgi:CheY-like chemotaxis protein
VKILVADDNRSIPKKVAEALKDQGHEVTGVAHGEAAVKKLPDFMPDLVLADVFMPVRNGYEVCEYVKNDTRFAHIPVVLLVGAFDPVDQHEVKRVRADGLLKKPFDPVDDLLAMVRTMGEKSAQARPGAGLDKESTMELSDSEMKGLLGRDKVQPAEVLPEPEEFSTRPARIEFGEGSEAMAFGELLESPSEPEAPKVPEEEGPQESESGFRASSIPDIEFAGEQTEEAPSVEPALEVAPEAPAWGAMGSSPEESRAFAPPAEEVAPETPQWGGIEVPAKEPSPDEPPIKVEFESAEPLELITEESAIPAVSHVEAGPLPELAASPDEFLSATASAAPVDITSAPDSVAAPPVHEEFSEVQLEAFAIPSMEEVAAPPAAEASSASPEPEPALSAVVAPSPEPAQVVPPSVEIPSHARALELDTAAEAAVAAAPAFTGNTDAFGRAGHVDAADMDAIVEKVIARLQKGVLDQITRDILRPIIEALVAREVENQK